MAANLPPDPVPSNDPRSLSVTRLRATKDRDCDIDQPAQRSSEQVRYERRRHRDRHGRQTEPSFRTPPMTCQQALGRSFASVARVDGCHREAGEIVKLPSAGNSGPGSSSPSDSTRPNRPITSRSGERRGQPEPGAGRLSTSPSTLRSADQHGRAGAGGCRGRAARQLRVHQLQDIHRVQRSDQRPPVHEVVIITALAGTRRPSPQPRRPRWSPGRSTSRATGSTSRRRLRSGCLRRRSRGGRPRPRRSAYEVLDEEALGAMAATAA